MCDELRENYKKCFEAFGARQCRMELDELFKCLYEKERYISYVRKNSPCISRALL
jgi:hypothetical protein